MLKNKVILLMAALTFFMTVEMNVQAASSNCPICATSDIITPLQMHGEHEGHYTEYHTAEYTENKILYKVPCTVTCTVDRVSWYCPKGHGTVLTQRHVVKKHSCSHCADLDYYE